jgi:hypothetical protein
MLLFMLQARLLERSGLDPLDESGRDVAHEPGDDQLYWQEQVGSPRGAVGRDYRVFGDGAGVELGLVDHVACGWISSSRLPSGSRT